MNTRHSQRLIQGALVLTFVAPFLGFLLFLNQQPATAEASPPDAMEQDPGGLRVSWLGAGSVYITDGDTALLTDPFFTRPSLTRVLLGDLSPNPGRIRDGLAKAGIRDLDAVIPLHSHYDHLLDAPWLASHLDALLIGSRSSANVARGAGLTEALIREVQAQQQVRVGDFRLTFVRSAHAPMAPLLEKVTGRGEVILHPFSTPARFTAWQEGEVYALIVRHPRGSLLVSGTAGFVPGVLEQQDDVDLALVSVGMLSRQTNEYQAEWFREAVAAAGADLVIPIHWDDPFAPLSRQTPAMPYFLDNASGSLEGLKNAAREAGISVRKLRPLDTVTLNHGPRAPMASSSQAEKQRED